MDISGNNLISVAVDEATVADLAGVKNTGEIYADGGRVIMTAKVASDLVGHAVNNEGLVRANSIVEKDGAIFLTAIGGDISNSGVLDASAAAGSNVDGGGVLVYSDRDITLSSAAAIHARGDGDGSGGVVRVIAEEVLDFQEGASISVAGSPHSGGFVEVSGHTGLKLRGEVDLGSGGTLLIDPETLTINAGGGAPSGTLSASVGSAFIVGQLRAGNDVYLVASDSINASTDLTITAVTPTVVASSVGDLNLVIGTIVNDGPLGGPGSSQACSAAGFCFDGAGIGSFRINPDPDGSIKIDNVDFNLAGGLNINAGVFSGSVSIGDINVGGNVTITAGGDINFQGQVKAAAGGLSATAGNDITIIGGIGNTGDAIGLQPTPNTEPANLNAGNDINIEGDIIVGSHDINLNADVDGNNLGDVNIKGSVDEPRNVITAADLNVSGQNFNITGAEFGTVAVSTNQDVPVKVRADRVIVNINGDMTVKGGSVDLDAAPGGVGRPEVSVDTSVQINGTTLVEINADNLKVSGGTAGASAKTRVAAEVNADATIVGDSIDISVTRSISVIGGTAHAGGSWDNATAIIQAHADAKLLAASDLALDAGSVVVVSGGVADIGASIAVNGDNGMILATAKAGIGAVQDVRIDADNGFAIDGGIGGVSFDRADNEISASVDVVGAVIAAAGDVNLTVSGGGIKVQGGEVRAYASTSANPSGLSVGGNADAVLLAGIDGEIGDINFVEVGDNLSILGGFASATASCFSCNADASARATVDASGSVQVSNVDNDLNIIGGREAARAIGNTCTTCDAVADAGVLLSGDTVSVDIAGSILLADGMSIQGVDGGSAIIAAADFSAVASNGSIQLSGLLDNTGPGGGSAWSLQAGSDIDLNLDIGSLDARFDDGLDLSAAGDVNINGDIFLASHSLVLAANTDSTAGGDIDIIGSETGARRVDTEGSLDISGANVNLQDATVKGDSVQIIAGKDIDGSSTEIDAEGIYIAAGNDLQLINTTTTVGKGTAPGVVGDSLVLTILEELDISLPTNVDPNLKFEAGGSMVTGDVEVTAANAYLWFETDLLTVGDISAPEGALTVQYSPFTPTLEIAFENEPSASEAAGSQDTVQRIEGLEQVTYYNSSHIDSLPAMTTVVIGSEEQTGAMTVGAEGPIDIGANNILFLTVPDEVDSPDNVKTNGIVATSGIVKTIFIPPTADSTELEISTSADEEEEQEGESQLVAEPEGDHGMCTAL
jgi:hypothetical protein